MSSADAVVQMLGSLSDPDRKWILQRLSPEARASLAGGAVLASKKQPGQANAESGDEPASDLTSFAARSIADVLLREPSWIAHIVMRHGGCWSADLERMLSDSMRSDLQRLEGDAVRYTKPLAAFVLDRVAERVRRIGQPPPPSRFDRLVKRLRSHA